ncbi:IS3 family transposase [Mycoplasmopsis felis]|uniref:IS3 family transposase n=1 Tax=Mycoplasmopsis felis TaxID=33923 RepID=UPI002AFF27A6|nr:IS3 family transposase [Mycoplasmopsis felis]WQQ09821.1 IS3 family transposase [Mycoplasmopsis felis]
MSRIGNSLDNREIEYFFLILKSEIFPNFNKSCQELTFSELSRKIKEYINWYNFKRIRL